MQSSLFITGIANTASYPNGRSDVRHAQRQLDTLRERREACRTVEEYKSLTTEINALERLKSDVMERQGQLNLER